MSCVLRQSFGTPVPLTYCDDDDDDDNGEEEEKKRRRRRCREEKEDEESKEEEEEEGEKIMIVFEEPIKQTEWQEIRSCQPNQSSRLSREN